MHIHIHHHYDDRKTDAKLDFIIQKLGKIMADLTTLETEVAENATVTESAITLLNGLKTALDEAGTDPVKLKALSDSLSNQTDSLAAAVSANTPAATL